MRNYNVGDMIDLGKGGDTDTLLENGWVLLEENVGPLAGELWLKPDGTKLLLELLEDGWGQFHQA